MDILDFLVYDRACVGPSTLSLFHTLLWLPKSLEMGDILQAL